MLKSLSAAWDRTQVWTFRICLRTCDFLFLVSAPRLLWAFMRIYALELRRSPYRWPRSFASTLARTKSEQSVRELVYGETPVVSGAWLFWRAGVTRDSRFVDLGAGRGRALLAARWLGADVRGVELLAEHVRLVAGILENVNVRIVVGDAGRVELCDATHLYIAWTGYSQETRDRIVQQMRGARPGTRIITVDSPVVDPDFAILSRHHLLYTWGPVPAWVQEYRPTPSADRSGELEHC